MTNMLKEIMEQPQVLRKCRQKNKEIIQKIVEQIESYKPHSVVFAGRGTSDNAGQYAKYLIEIYKGLSVSLISPSVISEYNGKLDLSGCLVIGVSQSGKTADVLDVIRDGNKKGALTLSITNNIDSEIAKEAKYHLCCEAGPELSIAATKTFATEIYLLFNLVAEWSKAHELLESIDRIPEMVENAISMNDEIATLASHYKSANEMFVLSRGITYPIAMEAALKMNETSYTRARPYSIGDFYHGPIAMLEKGTPVMLIDTDEKTRGDADGILSKLRTIETDIFTITTSLTTKSGILSLKLPLAYDGAASAFCVMAVVQMFACKLAELKGINPDAPRGLNKITVA